MVIRASDGMVEFPSGAWVTGGTNDAVTLSSINGANITNINAANIAEGGILSAVSLESATNLVSAGIADGTIVSADIAAGTVANSDLAQGFMDGTNHLSEGHFDIVDTSNLVFMSLAGVTNSLDADIDN